MELDFLVPCIMFLAIGFIILFVLCSFLKYFIREAIKEAFEEMGFYSRK